MGSLTKVPHTVAIWHKRRGRSVITAVSLGYPSEATYCGRFRPIRYIYSMLIYGLGCSLIIKTV